MSLLDKYTEKYGNREQVNRLRKSKEWMPETPTSPEKESNRAAAHSLIDNMTDEDRKRIESYSPLGKSLGTQGNGLLNLNIGFGKQNEQNNKEYQTYKAAVDILQGEKYEKSREDVVRKNGSYAYKTMKNYIDLIDKARQSRQGGGTLGALINSGKTEDLQKQAKEIKKTLEQMGITGKDFDKYEQYVREYKDIEDTQAMEKEIASKVAAKPVARGIGYTAADVAVSPITGFMATAESIKRPFYADPSAPVNTYSDLYRLQNASNAVEQSVSNQIDSKLGKFAYGVGVSTAKSAEAMLIGNYLSGAFGVDAASKLGQLTTLPMFGASAFAQTLQESQAKGFSPEMATQKALASGMAEMLFEELSLDKAWGTLKNAKLGKGGLSKRILDVFMGAGIEGSEELFTDLANYMADNFINGDFSDYQTDVRMRVENGQSLDQATREAKIDYLTQLGESFLAGAASGGLMNVGAASVGSVQYHNTARNINENTKLKSEVVESAKGLEGTTAAEIANSKSVEEINENDMVEILHSMEEVTQKSAHDIAKESLINAGETAEEAEKKANEIVIMSEQTQPTEAEEKRNIDLVKDENVANAYADVLKNRVASNVLEDVEKHNAEVKKIKDRVKGKEGIKAGYNNQEIKVYDFEDVEKGIVATSQGLLDLSEITLPDDMRLLFKNAHALENTKAANAFIDGYKGQSPSYYATGSLRAFMVGASGGSWESFINSKNPLNIKLIEEIGDNAYLKSMYFYGQNSRENAEAAKVETSKINPGKVTGKNVLNPLLEPLAKKFNVAINTTEGRNKAAGSFVPSELLVTLNKAESNNMLNSVLHETLGEYTKAYAPDAYKLTKQKVIDFARKVFGDTEVDKQIRVYQNTYKGFGKQTGNTAESNKTFADASDEWFNDFMAGLAQTEYGLERVVNYVAEDNSMTATEKTSVLQSIKDIVKKILDTIKSYLQGVKSNNIGTKAAKEVEKNIDKYMNDLNDIFNAVEKMCDAAIAEVNRQINSEAKAEEKSETKEAHSLNVDSEGNNLTEAQVKYFADSKVRDSEGRLLKVMHGTEADFTVFNPKESGGKNGTAEGFGIYFSDDAEVTKHYGDRQLEGYLNITKPAYDNKKTITMPGFIKLLKATTEYEAKKWDMDIKDTWISNYEDTYSNSLDAAYRSVAKQILESNDNDKDIIQEVMVGMGIRNYNQAYEFYDVLKKALGFDGFSVKWTHADGTSNVYVAIDSNQFKLIDNLTPTNNDDIRLSLNVDTEGNTLSPEKVEFYKDSAIRNELGQLKVMYHGTNEGGFTVFDANFSDDKLSFFFSDNINVSASYVRDHKTREINLSQKAPKDIKTPQQALEYLKSIGYKDIKLEEIENPFGENYEVWTFTDNDGNYDVLEDGEGALVDYVKDLKQGIYPVYLNVTNPLIVEANGKMWDQIVPAKYAKHYSQVRINGWDHESSTVSVSYVEDLEGLSPKYHNKEAFTLDEIKEVFGKYVYEDYKATNYDFVYFRNVYVDKNGEGLPATTRQYAKYAKEKGHDGVYFKNIVDVNANDENALSNVAVAFESNQVKSIYNEHPTNNPDIRYSLNVDSTGSSLSPEQAEFFKDSKARDDEGRLLVMYHGTDAYEEFTVFKPGKNGYLGKGMYFTEKKYIAEKYAEQNGYDGRVYQVYLNVKNPLVVTSDNPALEILGEKVAARRAMENSYSTRWLKPGDISKLKAKGYDGIIWKYGKSPVEISVWDPNQVKNTDNLKPTDNEDIRYSINVIVGDDGTNYGKGVYLDSTLLTNLTDSERREMVKERVKELGGQEFTAYDNNGNAVKVKIAEYSQKFRNANGDRVRVNNDLIRKYNKNETKQEAVVLVDELIETSTFTEDTPSNYPHGWLDDNGNNKWEYWDTYIVDKSGAIWKATLNITNASTGEKILYDIDPIDPIKKEGQAVKSATFLPNPNISQNEQQSNNSFSLDVEDWEKDFFAEMTGNANVSNILSEGLKSLDNIKLNKKITDKIAKEVKEEYKSKIKVADLSDSLEKVFSYMLDTGAPSYGDLVNIMKEVAKPVVDQATEIMPEEKRIWDDFKEKMKGYRIKLNPQQKAEVANTFGTYYAFKNDMFGNVIFSESGTDLDSIWTEICDASGGFLDYAENPANQPMALYEFVEALKPTPANIYGADQEAAAYDVALTIFRKFLVEQEYENNPKLRKEALKLTEAQQTYKKRVKENYDKKFKEATEELRREKEINMKRLATEIKYLNEEEKAAIEGSIEQALILRQKRQYEWRLQKLRETKNDEMNRKLSELKAKQRASITRRVEGRQVTLAKAKIRKNVEKLNSMLAHGTENRHIPKSMVLSTIAMLESIDINTGNSKGMAQYLQKMEDIYRGFKDNDVYTDGEKAASFDYDERTAANIEALRKLFDGRNYTQLTLNELRQVIDITDAVITQAENANKLLGKEKREYATDVARAAALEVRNAKVKDSRFMTNLDHYFTEHLNAYREFRKLSGYEDGKLMELYYDLDKGQQKQLQVMKDINAIFDDVLSNQKEVKRLTSTKKEDLVDSGLKDENGNPVMITRAQRLSLVMHSYNKSNMQHLLYGGISVPDLSYKDPKQQRAHAQTYFYESQMELRDAILDKNANKLDLIEQRATMKVKELEKQLSPWEKQFLEATKEMFWKTTGRLINETSLELKGYTLARVANYFPIKTDTDYTKSDVSGLIFDGTIEGMGFLKERRFGRNAMMLEDITDTILRQTQSVAKYVGLAIPVRNFNMVWNTVTRSPMGNADTLKKAISLTWGAKNTDYIVNLMKDLNGRRDGGEPSAFDTLRGRFAGAVLTLNPSVAIKQAASYFTAGAKVGNLTLAKTLKDLGKGFILKKGIPELEAINPLLWYRNQGNATQELADMKAVGFGKNLPIWAQKALNWVEFMDTGTVRTLEYAAKNYVDANFKDLTGAEYWQKVSDVFTSIVEETQPNYTVLQQADIIRNPNRLLKAVVMFKTQPLQNFGTVYDAVGEYAAKVRKGNKAEIKEAGKHLAWALSSQIASAVTFSAMTILADMILHKQYKYKDDDKSFWEMVLAKFGAGVRDCFLGAMLAGQELYEGLEYAINKWILGKNDTYYGLEVSFIGEIADIEQSTVKLGEEIVKRSNAVTEADRDKYNKGILIDVGNVINYTGQLTGVPLGNIKNMFQSLILYAIDVSNGTIGEAELSREVPNQYERMYDALKEKDSERYNTLFDEMVTKKMRDAAEDGKEKDQEDIEKSVETSAKKYIKDGYNSGELTYDEAYTILTKEFGMEEDDAYFKLDEWLYKSEGHEDYTRYIRLSDAVNGQGDIQAEIDKLKAQGIEEDTIKSQLTGILKEDYYKGTLSKDKITQVLKEYEDLDENDIYYKFKEWDFKKTHPDESFSRYDAMNNAIKEVINGSDNRKPMIAEIKDLMKHGVEAKSLQSQLTKEYKPLYLELKAKGKASTLKNILISAYMATGLSQEDAAKRIDKWKENDK